MTRPRPFRPRGFTLIEVMVALAILAGALTILVRSVGNNVTNIQEAESISVVTSLSRGKMYQIEEQLIQDGFIETDQSTEGDFGDDGWPLITWAAKVEKVEIPSFDQLQQLQKSQLAGSGAGSGSGSGMGSDGELGGFGESALGGMLGMLGGGADAADAAGGSFIQSQFQLVQSVLEAAIRKVTLTVKWKVLGHDRDLSVVAYFTDPAGMDKVLGGLGQDTPATEDPPPPAPK